MITVGKRRELFAGAALSSFLRPTRLALLVSFSFLLSACLFDSGGSTTATTGNIPPVVADVSGTVAEDTPQTVTLLGADADGNALTYSVVTAPQHGVVTVSGGQATYSPAANYNGPDSFTYKANDGTVDSATATVSITVTPVNDAPTANAGAPQTVNEGVAGVTLAGSGSDVDGDTLSYSWAQTGGTPSVTLAGANTFTATFSAPTVTTDTTLTFTLTVSDGHGRMANATTSVAVRNVTIDPAPMNRLNDTGITTCGDYAFGHAAPNNSNSDVNCSLTTDTDHDPVPPTNRIDGAGNQTGQDGHLGWDVTANDDSDGHAGFSFTKISSSGVALPASATEWSCVKDNVTGLIWEVKTDGGGLHDKDWTYTWYDTNAATNGGGNGTANGGSCGSPATSQCDTSGYVTAVNTAGWCGVTSGWRMPSVTELKSISDLSRNAPSIDAAYFPNTAADLYWSGTPYADDASSAWYVDFYYYGYIHWDNRVNVHHVRLVRSGQ